jgi:hypothetical protein
MSTCQMVWNHSKERYECSMCVSSPLFHTVAVRVWPSVHCPCLSCSCVFLLHVRRPCPHVTHVCSRSPFTSLPEVSGVEETRRPCPHTIGPSRGLGAHLVLLQEYPFDIPTEAFSFQIFKQAFAAVQASVVHLQVCNSPRMYRCCFFPSETWTALLISQVALLTLQHTRVPVHSMVAGAMPASQFSLLEIHLHRGVAST